MGVNTIHSLLPLNEILSLMQKLRVLKILLISIFIHGCNSLFCQNECSIWLLNNNLALDFTSSPPSFITFNTNFTGEYESCVVVCDEISGELLFYANGFRVWNKNHKLMTNSGNLWENFFSTAQGSSVVKSSKKDIFYLFSLESYDKNGRLLISEINTKIHDGLGDVVFSKEIGRGFTEHMIAVNHPCNGIWLILHERENNTFVAHHLVEDQVLKVVKSSVGIDYSSSFFNGKFIGGLFMNRYNILISLNFFGFYETFKFDPYSGHISQPLLIESGKPFISGSFSPNDSLFYVASGDLKSSWIDQYDFTQYDSDAIRNSKTKVGFIEDQILLPVSKMAIAYDGKIYFTSGNKKKSLTVINHPNKKGLDCVVNELRVSNGFYLSNKALPTPLVYSNPGLKDFLPPDTTYCKVPTVTISSSVNQYDSLRWSDGSTAPSFIVNTPGIYRLTLYKNGCEYHDTMTITEIPARTIYLGPDLILCQLESHTAIVPTQVGDVVRWQDGNTEVQRKLSVPGQYIATIATADGCTISDTINIARSYQKVSKSTTILLCDGESFIYKGVSYTSGQTIIDSLTAVTGCDTLHTITLVSKAAPTLMRDTTTCTNAPFNIQSRSYNVGDTIIQLKSSATGCDTVIRTVYRNYTPPSFAVTVTDSVICSGAATTAVASVSQNVRWSTGATTSTISLTAGSYSVIYTDPKGCTQERSVTISPIDAPAISRDTTTCSNAPITIQNKIYNIGDTIIQLRSSPSGCDTVIRTIYRSYTLPPFAVSVADSVVCRGAATTAIASITQNIRWSTGASTSTVSLNAGSYSVSYTDSKGCTQERSVTVRPSPDLQYKKEVQHPICEKQNGSIRITNQNLQLPYTVSINGQVTGVETKLERLPPGKYTIIFTDGHGCVTTDSVVLISSETLIKVDMPEEIKVEKGKRGYVVYKITSGQADTIIFLPDTDILAKSDTIYVTGKKEKSYSITFADKDGCQVSKTLKVEVITPQSSLVLPNIVSLRGGHVDNTSFYLKAEGVTYDLVIYDRWGNVMHDVKKANGADASAAWRPQSSGVNQGVYVYLITIYTEQGVVTRYGSVTVL